jgi:hypothetical protein
LRAHDDALLIPRYVFSVTEIVSQPNRASNLNAPHERVTYVAFSGIFVQSGTTGGDRGEGTARRGSVGRFLISGAAGRCVTLAG